MKRVVLAFYQSPGGNLPVREWLLGLDRKDRKLIGIDLSGKKIARVLFCIHEQHLWALHGFIKKTQKIPKPDLNIALKRMIRLSND